MDYEDIKIELIEKIAFLTAAKKSAGDLVQGVQQARGKRRGKGLFFNKTTEQAAGRKAAKEAARKLAVPAGIAGGAALTAGIYGEGKAAGRKGAIEKSSGFRVTPAARKTLKQSEERLRAAQEALRKRRKLQAAYPWKLTDNKTPVA